MSECIRTTNTIGLKPHPLQHIKLQAELAWQLFWVVPYKGKLQKGCSIPVRDSVDHVSKSASRNGQ